MKHELIKKMEMCTVAGSCHCIRCSEMISDKNRNPEVKPNDSLYNKEVEQYYFYFLENKAS